MKKEICADEVSLSIPPAKERRDSNGFAVPSSPEISKLNLTPPYPSPESGFRRRQSSMRLGFKPKSRLIEQPWPTKKYSVQTNSSTIPTKTSPLRSPIGGTFNGSKNNTGDVITPRTPLMASPINGEDEDEDEDDNYVYTSAYVKETVKKTKKIHIMLLLEWIVLLTTIGIFITSLMVEYLKNRYIWGLRIWRWCVLILVVSCGHMITQWFMDFLVFLIEKNFILKRKVLYFVYALRNSVRVFVWLGLILLAWELLINHTVIRSRTSTKILNYITRGIASSLIGATMWMMKTFCIKLLATYFQVKAFFDRIQESIFHQYVLQTLSGPPLLRKPRGSSRSGTLSFKHLNKGLGEEVIDVDKLYKMTKEKISSWTMGGLIKVVRNSGLLTISEMLDDCVDDEKVPQKELASEYEAMIAAKQIFKKVAKPKKSYIEEDDLILYMPKEEADVVLMMFDGSTETGQIKKSAFQCWLVKVYKERKYLVHSLNDSKTAIEELNKIASGIILIIIIIVWLLLMDFVTTKVLVFITSQILLLVFMFGETCKVVFEAIIFVFITHPFDVGDVCVVDGVQMTVEEMNILTTIFLRYDNEMIYYPNSVLATKPIGNFNRSPEMGDSLEFAVDFSTSLQTISDLKAKVKVYLESNPGSWRAGYSLVIKEIEDMNKMKMALNVTHTINFQNSERSSRRSDLVLKLKSIFEELGIKYHILPQEVLVKYIGSENPQEPANPIKTNG